MHREADSQPNQKPKKTGGKGSVAILKNSKQVGFAIPGCRAAEIQFDFTEGCKILRTEAQRAILKRFITPHENSGKKGSIARVWFSVLTAVLSLRNLRTDI